ncbi:MAG: hypothetical protein ACKVQR_16185 [Aquabacterium sp.]
MPDVQACAIPDGSLLRPYQDGVGFADCYEVDVPGQVTQAAFIEAFYTSPLFKLERGLLWVLAARPATDADVRQLAAGQAHRFSAWQVEHQTPTELLLADMTGSTRSWLQVQVVTGPPEAISTKLLFGSAVVPRAGKQGRRPRQGWLFKALLPLHGLYSRLLLAAAARRVKAS